MCDHAKTYERVGDQYTDIQRGLLVTIIYIVCLLCGRTVGAKTK